MDPNDILGPEGFGPERWITATETMPFTIRFENAATASAPAQEVVITQQLDADLDYRTFRVDDFGFGDVVINVDGTKPFVNQRIDLTATRGFVVDVSASIDVTSGVATWRLVTIDPATGEKPENALTGFLPVNDANGEGEGFVSYTVKARRASVTGTVVDSAARIIFDTEEPIDTPPIFNTLDAGRPQSRVAALEAVIDAAEFTVTWSGTDEEGGSAVRDYDIYVSVDGGEFSLWLDDATVEEARYTGARGSRHAFYSVARDNAGNVEAPPATADASTVLAGRPGAISGVRFEDLDADGTRDAGEGGLAGWTVFLDANDNGAFDDGELSSITDADGAYAFLALAPGRYSVGLVTAAGWHETTPPGETIDFTISDGETLTSADFGGLRYGSLSGLKFEDMDGDGVRDAGENGRQGWTIFLDADRDGVLDAGERSTLTDTEGRYAFADLLPGAYTVAELQREGWVQTTPGVDGLGGLSVLLTSSAPMLEISTPSCACGGSWSLGAGVGGEDLGALAIADALDLTGIADLRSHAGNGDVDGRGIRTVVIDTGIDVNHAFFGPDLDGNGVADRIVYQWDFADNDGDASDRDGHGSHVASVIAGDDDRYGGVASGTELIVLKVFGDDGHGYFRDLERALQWVVANADRYDVGVVNLSLGDSGNWTDSIGRYGLGDELAALARQDLIVVGAAGNSYATLNRMGVAYPAADPAVIAVGATWAGDFGGPWRFGNGSIDYSTAADRIAGFSQRDTALTDTFAPGARFNGADANGGVRTMQGTSQAAAFVSGTAALAQQVAMDTLGRRLTTGEFAQLLRTTGADIVDGDDENDNVANTGATFQRLDFEALAAAIAGLPVTRPDTDSGTGGSGTGGGSTTPENAAAPGVHAVTLSAGQDLGGLDFGNFELGGVIGTVVNDVDGDGVVDPGEAGLAGRTVFLDADEDGVLDIGEISATTGADGRYSLANVGPGRFTLVQSTPTGWVRTGAPAALWPTSGAQETIDLTQGLATFHVTAIEVTPSGFHASFNRAFDAGGLNLYGGAGVGPSDVEVTGPGGAAVAGSVVLDANLGGFTFVKTGGPMAAGEYAIRLASRIDGFHEPGGALLDGDADGVAGGDHLAVFTVAPVSLTVSLPDVMRGPGQALGTAAHPDGLAVRLSSGTGVSSVGFTLRFDPLLIEVTGVVANPALPVSASMTALGAGAVRIAVTAAWALPAGSIADLVTLRGRVLSAAGYGTKQVLDLDDVTVNGGTLAAAGDDSVHVVGFIGDASGNAAYSTLDVQRVARVAAGTDSGFSHWGLVDPVIVGDVTGNGLLSAQDGQRLLQRVAGRSVPEIPALPPGVGPITPGGPDPLVQIARNFTVSPSGSFTVPVILDTAADLEAVQLTIGYDPAVLEFVGVARGSLTSDFQWLASTPAAGQIAIDLTRHAPRGDGSGSLVDVTFRVRADAPRGPSPIDLQWAYLNDGRLTLVPAPQPGLDPTDGSVTVDRPAAVDPMSNMLQAVVASRQGWSPGVVDWTRMYPGPDNVLRSDVSRAGGERDDVIGLQRPGPDRVSFAATAAWWGQQSAAGGDAGDWRKTPWARDLAQRLAQLPGAQPGAGSLMKRSPAGKS